MSDATFAAVGVCPVCGGRMVEVPFSRFSACEDCAEEAPTSEVVAAETDGAA